MCKLCNIYNRTSAQPSVFTRGTKYQDFVDIVLDYTGENPCRTCMSTYAQSRFKSGSNVDNYIYIRLVKAYATRGNAKRHKTAKRTMKKIYDIEEYKAQSRKAVTKYNKRVFIREYVEKNIGTVINTNTQHKVYRVQINKDYTKYCKCFNTLSEAQQYKQEVLNNEYKTA